jgi:hypothetical protein
VFLVNSRLGRFPAAEESRGGPFPSSAPLLPKLRGDFAEFLNGSSLARLWILSSPTCVRLRYGPPATPSRLFLAPWRTGWGQARPTLSSPAQGWGSCTGERGRPTPRSVLLGASPRVLRRSVGAGISTGCPSGGPLSGAPLGPPNLQRTNLPEEPLGFRRRGFSPLFSLLRPASSLEPSPGVLSDPPSLAVPRSPTQKAGAFCHGFGGRHSPLPFSAPHRLDP